MLKKAKSTIQESAPCHRAMNSRLVPEYIRDSPSTPPGSHVVIADNGPCPLSHQIKAVLNSKQAGEKK